MSKMAIVASVEIDKAASDKNLQNYVNDIKARDLKLGVSVDLKELAQAKAAVKDIAKSSLNFDGNGLLQGITRTITDAMGDVYTQFSKVNEEGREVVTSVTVTTNLLQKQKQHYNELVDLTKKLGKLDQERLNASGETLKVNKDETKEIKKQIKQKQKYIEQNGLENAELQLKVEKQQIANNQELIRLKAKNQDDKGAKSYDKLLKAMKQELAYEKQKISADKEEIALLDKKIKKEQTKQNSARSTLWRNKLNTDDGDRLVKETKELYEEELKITKEKYEQAKLYDEIESLEKQLQKTITSYGKSKGATERAILNKQQAEIELEIEEKRQTLQEKGLVNEQRELDIRKMQSQYDTERNLQQARYVQMLAEEQQSVDEAIAKHQRKLAISLQNLTTGRNKDYISDADLEKIEQLRHKIAKLNGATTKDVRKEVELLRLEIQEITANANQKRIEDVTSGLTLFQKSIKRVAGAVSIAMITEELWQQFKVGAEYVRQLDDAYTDIAISMDITREKFNAWTQDARKIAQANGILTTDVMDMVKIYASAGETIEDIEDKLAGTAMIQNITQWDTEQTTSAVNSVINQYKLLEKEINGTTGNMANAIQYMGDALVSISNELKVDNVAGIQEMVNAIDTAGGVMEQSGASMEWYMAIAGTLKETMNATGDEVGNAFKMISARIFAQSEAMEELGESTENIEVEARKAEEALNSVGIAIRDANNPSQLRDMEDIINDLAKQWDTLTDATKNYVAEGVAGTNRRNYFISMMENYGRITELTTAGLEAQGALAEANEKRVQSLDGQINILKDKMLSLMDSFQPLVYVGIDFANSLVSGLTAVTNFITNSFVPIMGAAAGAVVALEVATKGLIFTNVLDFFKEGFKAIASFATKTVVATGAVQGLTVGTLALKMALGGIIGGAIIGGIYAITKAIQSSHKSIDEMANALEERMGSINSTTQQVNSLSSLSTKYTQINAVLESTTKGSDLYNKSQEELLQVQQQIAEIAPHLTTYIDEHGNSYATSKESLDKYIESQKQMLELEKQTLEMEAKVNKKSLEKQIGEAETSRESEIDKIAKYAAIITELQQKMSQSNNGIYKFAAQQDINMLMDAQNKSIEKVKEYNQTIIDGEKTLEKYNSVLGITVEKQDEVSKTTSSATTSAGVLANALRSINDVANNFDTSKVENATETYVQLAKQAKDIKAIIDDISTNGIHLDALDSASEYMKGFSGNIGNAKEVLKHLNKVLEDTNAETYALYANMLSYDSQYWTTANANSNAYFTNNIANTSQWADFQSSVYDQLIQLDAAMNNSKVGNYNNYFQHIAANMQKELQNAKNLAEAKVAIETAANKAIMEQHAIVASAMKDYGGYYDKNGDWVETSEYHEFDNYKGVSTADSKAAIAEISAWKANALAAIQSIDALINTAPTFTNAIGNISDKLSNTSEAAKKLVADLEDIADAYYEISNALKDVDNALEQNRTEQGYADPQRLVELYQEEIELLKEKQDLLFENKKQAQAEADSIKKYLQSQGFSFDGEDIENYSDKFASLRKWANSLTGEEKENAIAYVESLMEQVERYTDLVKDEIPGITNEWMDMTNQIREAEKELAEVVTQTQKDIANAIENALNKRYNAIKKELEKEKALYEQQYEEEDYEDALSEEQRKLDEIQQQINDISRDTSLAGQLKLQQLRAEYEAQQKVIDDMIRDHQREEGSNRFDEEMDKLDEELEDKLSADNLANMVNQALVDGFVTIGDEVIELNSLMSDWLNETGDGLLAIGDYLREEFIDQLIVAKELLADMGITGMTTTNSNQKGRNVTMPQESYDFNSSAMNGLTSALIKGGQPTQAINLGSLLNIEGNVTEDVLPKVESMLNRAKTDILNNLAKQLSYR